MTHSSHEPTRPGPIFPGPLLLLFPLLMFAGAIQYQRTRRPEPGAPPEQPSEVRSALVPGWLGRIELTGGAQLRARLTRLHMDESWQQLDAASLARRLDLGAGEPWRLELSIDGDEAMPAVELGGLRVVDGDGVAAAALEAPALSNPRAVLDPLWGALAAPERAAAGETARLVLWGRAPEGEARLSGGFGELSLYAEAITVDDADSVLASLEKQAGVDQAPQAGEQER